MELRKVFLVSLVLVLLVLTGCSEDESGTAKSLLGPDETESAIVGGNGWIHEVVANYNYVYLYLDADNTYIYANLDSPEATTPYITREGTYTIDGTTLILGACTGCDGDGEYTIEMKENGNEMTLLLVDDGCTNRKGELPGDWQIIED